MIGLHLALNTNQIGPKSRNRSFVFIIIIIIIINEYPEAGQRPLFPSEVDSIYTNIN